MGNALGLVVVHPVRGVGQALDAVQVGYVVVVGFGEFGAEVVIALAPGPSAVRPERGWRRPSAVPPELRLPSAVPPELRLPSAVPPELRRPSAVPPEPTCGMISLLDRLGHR